jgi:hypothetical protein
VGISVFPLNTVPTKLMIDPQAGMVYSTLFGDVAASDLMQHIASIRAHPDFDPSFNELVDATQLALINLSSEDVRAFALQESPFLPSSKRVLVASEDLTFGLARMFQVFGGEKRPNFDVVRTLAEARKLLGLNDSDGVQ